MIIKSGRDKLYGVKVIKKYIAQHFRDELIIGPLHSKKRGKICDHSNVKSIIILCEPNGCLCFVTRL